LIRYSIVIFKRGAAFKRPVYSRGGVKLHDLFVFIAHESQRQ